MKEELVEVLHSQCITYSCPHLREDKLKKYFAVDGGKRTCIYTTM